MEHPGGLKVIALLFGLSGAYLLVIGAVMLISPGAVSMRAGADLLFGLELAGPFMFLLTGFGSVLIAFGLTRLNQWARRAAILVGLAGMVMLIPPVSGAVVYFQMKGLFWNALALIVRVIIVWYLYQAPVTEAFQTAKAAHSLADT
jgi:hypothetical protein